jgi:hypothetical protein
MTPNLSRTVETLLQGWVRREQRKREVAQRAPLTAGRVAARRLRGRG